MATLDCRIGCDPVSQGACERALPPGACGGGRTGHALREAVVAPATSRYLAACAVFFGYSLLIMLIDIYAFGGAYIDDQGPLFTGKFVIWTGEYANQLYLGANIVHLINAVQFVFSWHGRSWRAPVVWPEYLNVIGAGLYIASSTLYGESNLAMYGSDPAAPSEDFVPDYRASVLMTNHGLEMAAAAIELLASCGWVWAWYHTFPRKQGRGFTLDDLDFHASVTIFLGALLSFAYNIQIQLEPETYGANTLYIIGDAAYLASSLFYLLAAMRDAGFLWWAPVGGRCASVPQLCPAACAPESSWKALDAEEEGSVDTVAATAGSGAAKEDPAA